jgi:hypothetical protein
MIKSTRPHKRPARLRSSPLDRLSPEKRVLAENAIQDFLAYCRARKAAYALIYKRPD